jgi:hypothetical protein
MGMYVLSPTSGSTLQSAVGRGNLESVDLLIAHDAVLSYADTVHVAVDSGSLDMMAYLLELGADIEQLDSVTTMGHSCHGTPLLRAIAKGKTDAVRFLLENGASTTARGHNGETPMKMVREDWVADEIRKMVEEVGEREPRGTGKGREGGEKEGEGTEKEREVEERDGKETEKDREEERRESGGMGDRVFVGPVGKYDIGYGP